jgi:S1-C subfamily serine protease
MRPAGAQINVDPQRGVMTLAPVIAPTMPAVVQIIVQQQRTQASGPDPLSSGSGVIVDGKEGYILTNHHVIANSVKIRVKLVDERVFDAQKIGSDEATDIGLIKISATNLIAMPADVSSDVRIGDFVMAIGYPFGLDQTVTLGVVSGLGRGTGKDELEDFIQTDASINPGNSGGALIDTRGRLVGINSMIYTRSGGNVGIGYAVPTKIAFPVIEQLKTYGEVRRGRLGVDFRELTSELATAVGVRMMNGLLITRVPPGSLG